VAKIVWGLTQPRDVGNARLRPYHGYALGGYDLASCMFAIHYFFGSLEHLANIARNVSTVLRPGGCFVGCCLDGARVHAALSEEESQRIEGRTPDGSRVTWSVERKHDTTRWSATDPASNAGLAVDVYMETIGQTLPEYLVDFRLLVRVMGEHGMEPLAGADAAELGLRDGTGFFDDLFEDMVRRGSKGVPAVQKALEMTADDKRYSFMNRWFVFKKVHQ
jgi:SAM-dependent methyltransferase